MDAVKNEIRKQDLQMLIETLEKLERSAKIKTLRDGFKVKIFSNAEKIVRAAIYDVIEEKNGEEFAEKLFAKFEV